MPNTRQFTPHLDILPPEQRRLWDELDAIADTGFVLYGGTAIALHLGHRRSVDFDFFGAQNFNPAELLRGLPFLTAATITQQAPDTLSAIVDRGAPVKVSFFGLPRLRRLAPPCLAPGNHLPVAAPLDLSGTKAAVVQQRAESRDYIDIDAIMTRGGIDLPTALAAATIIHGPQFNPQITLKALSYFDDGDLPNLPRAVKDRLARAAREVDLDRLPTIVPGPAMK